MLFQILTQAPCCSSQSRPLPSPLSIPSSLRCNAKTAINLSPSINPALSHLPVTRRSASPSSASPTGLHDTLALTALATYSGCIAPQPSLILKPFGLSPRTINIGTKFIENSGCHHISGSIGTVYHNAHPRQCQRLGKRVFDMNNVAPDHIINPF